MTSLPDWVGPLTSSPLLHERGFVRLDAAERDELHRRWLHLWAQVPFDEAFHDACRERIERAVPLLRGPSRARTLGGQTAEMLAFFDPIHPDEVSVSLSPAMPAPLAPRTGTTPESFLQNLATYLRDDRRPSVTQPRAVRLLGQVDAEVDVVQRNLQAYELWLDDAHWGSSCDDDPWLDLRAPSALDIARLQRTALQQDPTRFPSIATRTLWSQSTLRFERHLFGAAVFDLRYTPTDDPTPLRRFRDELIPLPVPDDVPLDLVASILRASLLKTDALARSFAQGEAGLSEVASLVVLGAGEPETVRTLQRWIEQNGGDEELLLSASEIFCSYTMMGLAWEVYGRSGEGPERDQLERWLLDGPMASGEVL